MYNYKLHYLIRLLHDFLTIDLPSAPPARSLTKSHHLGIPLHHIRESSSALRSTPRQRQPLTIEILARCIQVLLFVTVTLVPLLMPRSKQYSSWLFKKKDAQSSPLQTPGSTPLAILACLTHDSASLVFNIKHSKTDKCGNITPIFIFRLNTFLSPYEPLLNYPSCPTCFSFWSPLHNQPRFSDYSHVVPYSPQTGPFQSRILPRVVMTIDDY